MKIASVILLLLMASSCGKIENSSSTDNILYGEFTDTGSPDFLTAKAAIRANCLQCHAVWKNYLEQDFIDAGLVVRGDPANSKLYYRNLLATEGPGPHNMPASGYPPIAPADLSAMHNWISAL
jgi:hypothetical protein